MAVRAVLHAVLFLLLVGPVAGAQPGNVRDRAKRPYDEGLDHLRQERFDAAANAFEAAVAIDGSFDMAYYMLGRAHLARKQ